MNQFGVRVFRSCILCVFLVFFLGFQFANGEGPLTLHSENPHYFSWKGKPAILITSGEHYGALLNRDFDYKTYLKTLHKDGLNHTRIFSGTYREVESSFGITDNPLSPKPDRFLCPWPRSEQKGANDGENRFDLSRFDPEYFQTLDDFMTQADRAGVIVEYTLFCPLYRDELWEVSPMNIANNINGVGDCERTEVLTLKHPELLEFQLGFVRKAVRELNRHDNFYFEVCNEPYFGGVTEQWQHRVIDEIVKTEKALPKKHLISMNIANGHKKVDSLYPGVSILNFHYCVPPVTVEMNWELDCVIGENETGFRGSDDILYRTEGWDFILAGGALYNNLDYSFTPGHPDGTLRDYRSPGGGSPELRDQLAILKEFIESFDFVRMAPASEEILSAEPDLSTYCLAEPGKQYAVYLHVPIPKNPKKLSDHLRKNVEANLVLEIPEGTYRVEWIDTKNGEVVKEEQQKHPGGKCTLHSPRFENDIAIKILRK